MKRQEILDLPIGLGWKLQLYHVTMALKQERIIYFGQKSERLKKERLVKRILASTTYRQYN